MTLAERLLPELETQLDATRRVLSAVPDGHNDFVPHEKSMLLSRLAGHTAELVGFAYFHLTTPGINMGTPEDPRKILRMSTRAELLVEFESLAARLLEALKSTTTRPSTRPSPSPARAPSSALAPATTPTAASSSTT